MQQKHFEVYIIDDSISTLNWQKLYQSILLYLGIFCNFEITFQCLGNVIRIFISCKNDINLLSNCIEGMLLKPVDKSELNIKKAYKREYYVGLVTGGNLIDLKEKLAIKKSKELQYVTFKILAINSEKAIVYSNFYLADEFGVLSKYSGISMSFPSNLLSIDFTKDNRYFKKTFPKYLNIEKSLHMMVRESNDAIFEIDTFPYISQNYYLNLTKYDFDKHSFIIGASGSGKSKLISLIIDRLNRTVLNYNYRIVVIDPHASLADDFSHILNKKVITFDGKDNTDLFPDANTDIASATELTTTLFKSILNSQFNPRLDKLLRFSLFTLMTAQIMSLENLKRFLTETEYRIQIVEHVKDYIPQNIVDFFGTGFNELRTKNYDETILPLISMVDEMQLQPSLVGESEISLARTIQENFLTVFSLNKISMGEKVTKTVAGLLIQQIFLLSQAKVFGQKLILIIDEVSVVQNPALVQILAEARKFNLTVILTQQYFGQVDDDLRKAIFSNVYNYYVFKVSEDDARALEGNINIDLPKELIISQQKKGLKEQDIKIKIMTELQPRECLVRVMSNGYIVPCIKSRTMDAPVSIIKTNIVDTIRKSIPSKFIEDTSFLQNDSVNIISNEPEFISMTSSPPDNDIFNLLTMSKISGNNINKEIK